MKKWGVVVVLLLLVRIAGAAPFDSKIQSIIKESRLTNSDISIYALSLPQNKVLADIDKDKALNPASCMKLVTSAAALKNLGPNYQFPTRFYIVDTPQGKDLYIKGYGDPSFVIERMEAVVTNLIKARIPNTINNIFIDDNYFDRDGFPGRKGKSTRSYNAMTSAVALNHAAVTVEVFPSDRVGQPAEVVIDAPGITVTNLAKTASPKSKSSIKIFKIYTKNGDSVKVTGQIAKNSGGRKQYFSVQDPSEHFGNTLRELLKSSGVNVTSSVEYAAIPYGARLFYEEKSPFLSEILKDMNKNSNNFMAEQIVKTLGAVKFGEQGTTEKGVQVITEYLNSIGVKNFLIENGSGLSYKNHISSGELMAVMKDMYARQNLRDVFIDSLSISGVDGTLKKWQSPVLMGRLKAKTGSLNGISALAGFMPNNNEMILFSIMLNGRVDFTTGRKVSEKIVETLVEGR